MKISPEESTLILPFFLYLAASVCPPASSTITAVYASGVTAVASFLIPSANAHRDAPPSKKNAEPESAVPDSTIIPPSVEVPPPPSFKNINLSSTSKLAVETVVVAPLTIKSPVIVTLLEKVLLPEIESGKVSV